MIGNYLGSARSVLNTGEYRALYLTHAALPVQLSAPYSGLVPPEWEPHRLEYIRQAQRHAVDFVVRTAESGGFSAFCDSSPRNVLIAPTLAELFPDALFVLTLRHYAGAIQSLLRLGTVSLLPGSEPSMDWVEPNAVAAAIHWSNHYEAAMTLPRDRTIVFGFDRFCANPAPILARFKSALAGAGFPVDELHDDVFATSHASVHGRPRPTVGRQRRGGISLDRIPSYDAKSWSAAIEAEVQPAVGLMDAMLSTRFSEDYAAPLGYPGPDVLLEAVPGAKSPSGPTDGEEFQVAPAAAPPPARSGQPAPAPPRVSSRARGRDTSSRARRARGR
jgi:hypothetical protein